MANCGHLQSWFMKTQAYHQFTCADEPTKITKPVVLFKGTSSNLQLKQDNLILRIAP